jgi:hypothetical protein
MAYMTLRAKNILLSTFYPTVHSEGTLTHTQKSDESPRSLALLFPEARSNLGPPTFFQRPEIERCLSFSGPSPRWELAAPALLSQRIGKNLPAFYGFWAKNKKSPKPPAFLGFELKNKITKTFKYVYFLIFFHGLVSSSENNKNILNVFIMLKRNNFEFRDFLG